MKVKCRSKTWRLNGKRYMRYAWGFRKKSQTCCANVRRAISHSIGGIYFYNNNIKKKAGADFFD